MRPHEQFLIESLLKVIKNMCTNLQQHATLIEVERLESGYLTACHYQKLIDDYEGKHNE